ERVCQPIQREKEAHACQVPLASRPARSPNRECDRMSEPQEPSPPQKKAVFIPGQPLPRLWKTEPEPDEEPDESGTNHTGKKSSKGGDTISSQAARKVKSTSGTAGRLKAGPGATGEGGNRVKKVLLEETPALDTYESRRRARLIVSGLSLAC